MSALSSLSLTTGLYSSYTGTGATDSGQTQQGLNAIGTALQSGEVSAAQRALAAFQSNHAGGSETEGESGDSGSNPFTGNSQASADYKNLIKDLGAGNLAAAQKDYAQMQTDLKLHGAHPHRGGSRTAHSTGVQQFADATTGGTSGNIINVTV